MTVLVLTADQQRRPHHISRKRRAVIAVSQLDQIGDLDIKALEQLDHPFIGDASCFLVRFIVGIHILVKAEKAVGMGGRL